MSNKLLTLRLPEDIHRKFKLFSVGKGKSMTEIILDFIGSITQNIKEKDLMLLQGSRIYSSKELQEHDELDNLDEKTKAKVRKLLK